MGANVAEPRRFTVVPALRAPQSTLTAADEGTPMGLTDLIKRADELAAEHEDHLKQAVEKAAAAADRQTGGRYAEQIARAGAKAGDFVSRRAAQGAPAPPDTPSAS